MSGYQTRILELLAGAQPQSTERLAAALGVDRGACGELLRRMEVDGLVRAVRPVAVGAGKCWKTRGANVNRERSAA